MKAHRTDGVSLSFAIIFLAIVGWWLLAQVVDLDLPAVGWFVAGALILLGVLGLLRRAARGPAAGRRRAPVEPVRSRLTRSSLRRTPDDRDRTLSAGRSDPVASPTGRRCRATGEAHLPAGSGGSARICWPVEAFASHRPVRLEEPFAHDRVPVRSATAPPAPSRPSSPGTPAPRPACWSASTPTPPVLAAAIDALLPGDTLTVVGERGAVALRAHRRRRGSWVADRVRVVDSLAEADAAPTS